MITITASGNDYNFAANCDEEKGMCEVLHQLVNALIIEQYYPGSLVNLCQDVVESTRESVSWENILDNFYDE